MRKYNDGMIRTNDKCIGCNKCISVCPIIGANSTVLEGRKSRIAVASDKCIHCGACLTNCGMNAREYIDDTEAFFEALKAGRSIALLVDPTFYALCGKEADGYFGYLKSLGVAKIYDVAVGVEIAAWANAVYLKEQEKNPQRAYILNTCSAVVNSITTYHPNLINSLIPVHSPAMCSAIYARNYENEKNAIAYLSPCPSKKDEMRENGDIISYNVTIDNFIKYLKDVDLDCYKASADVKARSFGTYILMETGFSHIMRMFFERDIITLKSEKITDFYEKDMAYMESKPELKPMFAEIGFCRGGCLKGSGAIRSDKEPGVIFDNLHDLQLEGSAGIRGLGSPEANFGALCDMMKDYDIEDFYRSYTNKYKQPYLVPESAYDEIFIAMHKEDERKRNIDCGSCGYDTCRDMAKAVAFGYSKMENCIHYMNDELLIRYYTDALTGIDNKEGFTSKVRRLYDENPYKTYVIGVVSLNQLNIINDLHGFAYGDALICKAAKIAMNFTDENGACARLGGGEFLLCFENSQENIERIQSAGTYSFEDLEVSFPLSFRCGLYIDKDRSEGLETMLNYASLARDKIEEDGVSTSLFYNMELRERLASEAMVTSQMYKALERKEFVGYFQPQVSHRTGEIVGAEMLCRWIKKDGSVISPGLFIPIFEKNGFIKALDRYMWKLAFETVTKWNLEGYKSVPLSVNVSRVSLNEPDFVECIEDLHRSYPIEPSLIHFEVTESAYSERQDVVSKKITDVQKMGFKIAMDDFGSGYSSLNILKDMPLDILKLDMGFLRGRNQEKGESIIRNVVAMIKELDLKIISEGVETTEQAEFLKHVGCDIMQGYLYARPMPQDQYEEMIR